MSHPQLTALQRKAGIGRPAPDHGVVTPQTALLLAISKAGQDALRLALVGDVVEEQRLTLGGMEAFLPEDGLCVAIRRHGGGIGLVALDTSLLAAVLQAKTTGKVTGTTVSARKPTQTDATLARGFLTLMLDSFGAKLAGRPQANWAAGFQPRERVADLARLPHLLDDVEYRGLSVDVAIANGLRRGRIELIVPHDGSEFSDTPKQVAEPDPRRTAWQEALSQRVHESAVELEAVLHRLHLPLSELARLAPGAELTLPATALDTVSLVDGNGRRAAIARLGQMDGRRALKIVSSPRQASPAAGQGAPDGPDQHLPALAAPAASQLPAVAAEMPDPAPFPMSIEDDP